MPPSCDSGRRGLPLGPDFGVYICREWSRIKWISARDLLESFSDLSGEFEGQYN